MALQRFNHKCVYSYLTSVLSGQARTIILSEEVGEDPKKAWDALADEYARRTDMEVEVALNEWYRMSKNVMETGMQFLIRLDIAADNLAKRGKNPDDQAKLTKARECLLMDKKYRHVIEGSLLNPNLTYAALKKTIIELDALHSNVQKESNGTQNLQEESALKSQQYQNPKPRKRPDGSIIRNGNYKHCGKHSHFAFECRNKDKPQTEEGKKVEEEMKKRKTMRGRLCQEMDIEEEEQMAKKAGENGLPDCDMIVDSAAFPTLHPNACNAENVTPVEGKGAKTANGGFMKVEMKGNLSVFASQPTIRASIASILDEPLLSVRT